MKKQSLLKTLLFTGLGIVTSFSVDAQWTYNAAPKVYTTYYGTSTLVGIGTSNPVRSLHVANAGGWKARFSGPDGYIDIGPANSSYAHIYTDRSKFIFNKPIYSMNGFHSHSSHLNLEAASGYYVNIQPRSSSYGLILREYNSSDYGNIEVTSAGLGLGYNTSGAHLMIHNSGKVGVGTTSPMGKLEIVSYGTVGSGTDINWNNSALLINQQGYLLGMDGNQLTGNKELFLQSNSDDVIISTNGVSRMFVNESGLVGIGLSRFTNNSVWQGAMLAVNGGILCEKVKVISNVPSSDYVFEKNYELMPLTQVEEFISQNSHLPEVPSAEEFKENGYNIGDMDDLLLRKVEELTLYIIEQDKKIRKLSEELEQLKIIK
ncbi:MAG TPA: hypothetical protein DDX98_14255 [Bacteroidales bacterium]|jgi:hypothetical protein|nr:hypothetical protein [Bacteroidales bacterium]